MKKILYFLIGLALYVNAGTINIAVAANVSYAMDELIKEFNKENPETTVQPTLSSSGKLTAQIKNKAPFSIFMSANMKFPQTLFDEGFSDTKPIIYAKGSLAMFSKNKKDFSKGIDLTKDDSIKKIAIANPEAAPYGKAALESFKNAKIFDDIEKKLVYAESISQTLSFALAAADLAFIAKSSLYDPKMSQYKDGENFAQVDPSLYAPIEQGIIIVKGYGENKEVKAFYDFILGDKAKNIFIKYGYLVQ